MVIGAATLERETKLLEFGCESFGVFDNFGGVGFEFWLQSLTKGDGFRSNDVFERATLSAGENGAINQDWEIGESFFGFFKWGSDIATTKNQTATRAAQGFVRGGGHDVETKIERIWVDATGDETGNVRHISHQKYFVAGFLTDGFTDFSDASKIGNFHKGGVANQDEFREMLKREAFELIIVNIAVFGNAIADKVINMSAQGDFGTVSEMTAGWERHAKYGVARFEPGKVNCVVGLGARMGLDIGVVGMEEFASPLNGEAFDAVNVGLPTVIAIVW